MCVVRGGSVLSIYVIARKRMRRLFDAGYPECVHGVRGLLIINVGEVEHGPGLQ